MYEGNHLMPGVMGLEPILIGLTNQYFNQLNYTLLNFFFIDIGAIDRCSIMVSIIALGVIDVGSNPTI